MKDVTLNEIIKGIRNKKVIDEKVLKCYYSICRYYNKEDNLIMDFISKSCQKSCQKSNIICTIHTNSNI